MTDEEPEDESEAAEEERSTKTEPHAEVITVEQPGQAEPAESAREMSERVEIANRNAPTLGELVLSYPSRDVALVLDGATAARALKVFAQPELRRRLQDELVLGEASMTNPWVAFDLRELMAVSWYPNLPSPGTQRMTVDPPTVEREPAASAPG